MHRAKDFLRTPAAQELRSTTDKWDFKNFKTSEQQRNKQFSKEEAWNGKESCQLYIWQQTAIWNIQITFKKKEKQRPGKQATQLKENGLQI